MGVELVGHGVELSEGGSRSGGVLQGDGPVQSGDGRRRQMQQQVV
jgi:hypothetical protein